ncbi:MAG: NUDIX domain-containing protein [Actinomycetota bacterium]
MGSPADELVEVIDADGNVERIVTRAEMRAQNLPHRNIAVVVQRSDGRLVVHQRADWKDVYPSLWDVAFGGVPAVGESDVDAAVREVAEEAGIDVTPDELRPLGRRARTTEAVSWVGVFFLLVTDAELHPADGEVAQMAEVTAAELRGWADTHPLCPDVVPLLDDLAAWLD